MVLWRQLSTLLLARMLIYHCSLGTHLRATACLLGLQVEPHWKQESLEPSLTLHPLCSLPWVTRHFQMSLGKIPLCTFSPFTALSNISLPVDIFEGKRNPNVNQVHCFHWTVRRDFRTWLWFATSVIFMHCFRAKSFIKGVIQPHCIA